ncbi:uncharacterized protein LY79DRAFT_400695 [Colletotrichum navitas]|uniref:Uncharacterized protein n=1 Tax=Colletotrichum navitas TaxID=681940 RepID=A0AAD8PPQ1_9PEZI|nr:uncharacterized protein LY79DRAFT_400695 [Colletotrichum navitas]KAK1573651.1 hypothetical protein LY79DRAFT_400695 [Colletotrichum navitas]
MAVFLCRRSSLGPSPGIVLLRGGDAKCRYWLHSHTIQQPTVRGLVSSGESLSSMHPSLDSRELWFLLPSVLGRLNTACAHDSSKVIQRQSPSRRNGLDRIRRVCNGVCPSSANRWQSRLCAFRFKKPCGRWFRTQDIVIRATLRLFIMA